MSIFRILRALRPKVYRYRSAITGRYVSAAYAKANPDITVREQAL